MKSSPCIIQNDQTKNYLFYHLRLSNVKNGKIEIKILSLKFQPLRGGGKISVRQIFLLNLITW